MEILTRADQAKQGRGVFIPCRSQAFGFKIFTMEPVRLYEEAEVLRERCRFKEALELYKEALSCLGPEEGYGRLEVLKRIGDCCRMLGFFEEAKKAYKEALEIAIQGGESDLEVADALVGLGLAQRGLGEIKEARHNLFKALELYQEYDDPEGEAFCLWALGGLLRAEGELLRAKEVFEDAVFLFEQLEDDKGKAYCYCGLGGLTRVMGKYDQSFYYYKNANQLFEKCDDLFGMAYSYCGIGNAYRLKEKYEEALAYFDKATTLYKEIGDKVSFAWTVWSKANTYKMLLALERGQEELIKAEELFEETKDRRGLILCKLNHAEILKLKGKDDKAIILWREAKEMVSNSPFKLEQCHVELYRYLMENNQDEGVFFDIIKMYKKLGSEWLKSKVWFPINLP